MPSHTSVKAPRSPTTTITGSFRCEVQTTQQKLQGTSSSKSAGSSGKMSTRGRKLLTAEEPEVLRPHCEKCGGGEALRPGLDCRCHCPQCSTGKPRCSSPRMALRREEEETCETFTTKLAMTRSRSAARHSALKSKSQMQTTSIGKEVQHEVQRQGKAVKSEASKSEMGSTSPISNNVKSLGSGSTKSTESDINRATLGKPKSLEGEIPRSNCSASQSRRLIKSEKEDKNKHEPKGKLSDVQKVTEQAANRPTCKRGRSEGLRLDLSSKCLSNDNLSSKYRRPHCPKCSQLGCLRNLEVVCYCDPCQEHRGEECSSPRMADFRKSHPGYSVNARDSRIA